MARFWNVGKANAEISRLEAEVSKLTTERDEAQSAVDSNSSEAVKAAEQLEADLATAKQTISTLSAERDDAKAVLSVRDLEIAALKSKSEGQAQEVKIQASKKALDIQATLGQPAAPAIPEGATTTTGTSQAKPLFGLARFIAAEKAESASKTK